MEKNTLITLLRTEFFNTFLPFPGSITLSSIQFRPNGLSWQQGCSQASAARFHFDWHYNKGKACINSVLKYPKVKDVALTFKCEKLSLMPSLAEGVISLIR